MKTIKLKILNFDKFLNTAFCGECFYFYENCYITVPEQDFICIVEQLMYDTLEFGFNFSLKGWITI